MKKNRIILAGVCLALLLNACGTGKKTEKPASPEIVLEAVNYNADTVTSNGFIAYDKNAAEKQPLILIVPEWWGVGDYVKERAKQLAGLGYVAFVVDMYGNGKTGTTPDEAKALAMPFYQNPQMAYDHLQAALETALKNKHVNPEKTAAIGYCFGGAMVLNSARMGFPVNGVVSFHGGVIGVPPNKSVQKADMLICHGLADPFVPEADVERFKRQSDSAGVAYTWKAYPDATHAFTNPDATENGKKFGLPIAYNAEADKASWKDMQDFFAKIFNRP